MNRVFRLDDECYVVYIGSDNDDYRPFLRIGAARALPDAVKSFISWVIVSDSFTGRILFEHDNLQLPLDGETRYAGDAELVARLKLFFEEKELPTAPVIYEVENPKDSARSFVYFHADGNLHVSYRGSPIFDLRESEERDRHFVWRAEHASAAVHNNPFRYLHGWFKEPGFLRLAGGFYAISGGKLGGFRVGPGYAEELAGRGIDPDLLAWSWEDGLSDGLACRLKRAAAKSQAYGLFVPEPGAFRRAAELFTAGRAVLKRVAPGEAPGAGELRLEADSGAVKLGLLSNGRPLGAWSTQTAEFALAPELLPEGFAPLAGIPYLIDEENLSFKNGLERFALDLFEKSSDVLPAESAPACKALAAAAKALSADPGLKNQDLLLEAAELLFGQPAAPETFAFRWNTGELLMYWKTQLAARDRLLKLIDKFRRRHAPAWGAGAPPAHWPLLGRVCLRGERRFVFYECPLVMSPSKQAQALKCIEAVNRLRPADRSLEYEKEVKKLEEFILGLTVPRLAVKPRPETESALDAAMPVEPARSEAGAPAPVSPPVPEARPEAATQARPEAATPAPAGAPRPPSAAAQAPGRETPAPSGRAAGGLPEAASERRPFGPSRRWLLPTLLMAVLVLAAGLGIGTGFFASQAGPASTPGVSTSAAQTGPVAAMAPEAPATPGAPAAASGSAGQTTAAPAEQKSAQAPGGQAAPAQAPGGRPAPPAPAAGRTPAQVPGAESVSAAALPIGIMDIHALVNRIAKRNGYRPLDRPDYEGKDPNWIYPGNSFVLPDESRYTVKKEDTLWYIATRYIRSMLEVQVKKLREIIEKRPIVDSKETLGALEDLALSSYAESLTRLVRNAIKKVKEGR